MRLGFHPQTKADWRLLLRLARLIRLADRATITRCVEYGEETPMSEQPIIAQRLYDALHKMAKGYMPFPELRRKCRKEYGLPYVEVLEMSYENMQIEAQQAIKGMRRPK